MPAFKDEIRINAPVESVWRIVSDPTHIPKLYRDVIAVEMNPPGKAKVGQRCKIVGKVGALRIASMVEFTRVDANSYIAGSGVPGGIFVKFNQSVALTRDGWDTIAVVAYDYAVDPAFVAKVPDPAMLDRVLEDTFRSYARNLKDLSELVPLAE